MHFTVCQRITIIKKLKVKKKDEIKSWMCTVHINNSEIKCLVSFATLYRLCKHNRTIELK